LERVAEQQGRNTEVPYREAVERLLGTRVFVRESKKDSRKSSAVKCSITKKWHPPGKLLKTEANLIQLRWTLALQMTLKKSRVVSEASLG